MLNHTRKKNSLPILPMFWKARKSISYESIILLIFLNELKGLMKGVFLVITHSPNTDTTSPQPLLSICI